MLNALSRLKVFIVEKNMKFIVETFMRFTECVTFSSDADSFHHSSISELAQRFPCIKTVARFLQVGFDTTDVVGFGILQIADKSLQ